MRLDSGRDYRLSIGATQGDMLDDYSEPLNLNFELLLNTNRSEELPVPKVAETNIYNKSSSSSLGGNRDCVYSALDSEAGGGECKNMERKREEEQR